MTVTHQDFLELEARNNHKMPKEEREQKVLSRGVGLEMEGLVNEPKWKLYLDAVNLILGQKQKDLKHLETSLLDREDPDVRKDYQKASGLVEGLTSALSCATTLIRQGVLAGKTLEKESG